MYPAEQTKLLLQVPTFERENETHETNRVQREADEPMVGGEAGKLSVGKDDVLTKELGRILRCTLSKTHLEVVDDTFAIQEVVDNCEEIPVQGFTPRVASM